MDIVCIRGDGDRPGDDVIEPLLATVEAGLSRGQMELDQGTLADEQQIDTLLVDLRLGQIIAIDDSVIGSWRGKLVGLSHNVLIDEAGNLSGNSTFTLRKPR